MSTPASTPVAPCPIAVVGLGALFPGRSGTDGFWAEILSGSDLISDVPPTHWLISDYYDADLSAPDRTYAKRGAFLSPVDFDALGWGVPPSIVPATDTSQLLALMVAETTLRDAAGDRYDDLDRSRISVVLGVTSAQELLGTMVSRLQHPIWAKALREDGLPEEDVQRICDRISAHYVPWQESSFPGLLGNVVAGRVANRLDLGGTNCVTDAACASAFSAISMAASELYLGTADLVLTGGVDTMNDIFMYMCFSKTPALSATGDCRPFSSRADGTMLGEGLGMFALKRLDHAERDGDRIYAVIRGVGSSSDGRAKSVYAPRSEGQARSLRRAYAAAGFGPETVELVEAHGTGTRAGDAAEFGGLRTVFDEAGREERQWCALGSVKSQIGHTKAAAGAAGLLKAIMALQHGVLPPTIKIDAPNPALELERSPFYLSGRARPWVRSSDHPRRAGVSSFGFGGSNFHIAVEEYTGPTRAPRLDSRAHHLVVLTAQTPAELAVKARDAAKTDDLPWLSWSSCPDVDAAAPARLAVVAADLEGLGKKLHNAAAVLDSASPRGLSTPDGLHIGLGPCDGDLAFVFPGQGSQRVDMGLDLALHFPEALAAWDAAADLPLDPPLQAVVFPRTDFSDPQTAADRLRATEWAQPAIGCASLATLRLLQAAGVTPAATAGHSFGEVSALHAAGVLNATDLLRVARRRGELMAEAARKPGAMIAVALPREDVEALVSEPGVVIANHNGPRQVVLSGETDAVERAEVALKARGATVRRLDVATAFHSPVVAEAVPAFAEALDGVAFEAAAVPVYAGSTAAHYPADAAGARALLSGQIARPVRFVETIEAMYAAGVRTFVEVGPGSVLTGLVGRILEGRTHRVITTDRRGRDGVRTWLEALAALVAAGHAVDARAVWAGVAAPRDPATLKRPKLALSISGANYGKPYPTPADAERPSRPAATRAPRAASSTTNSRAAAAPAPAAPARAAMAPSAPVSVTALTAAPAFTPPVADLVQSLPAVPAAPLFPPSPPASFATEVTMSGPTPPADAAWVFAYQEAQRQTAEAHAAYMQAMASTHTAFLQVAEAGLSGLSGMLTGHTPALRVAAHATPAPVFQAPAAPPQVVHIPAAPAAVAPAAVAPAAVAPAAVAPAAMAPAAVAPAAVAPAAMAPTAVVPAAVMPAAVAPAPRAVVPQPVAAAPAPAAPSGTDVQGLLLSVVAEKTGYPAEMLSLEMELESDLGIDSIKRVEILSGVQAQVPGLPEVDAAAMADLRTLGDIVRHVDATLGGGQTTARPFDVEVPPELGRTSIDVARAPAVGLATPGLRGGTLQITRDGSGLAEALAAELSGRGLSAEAVDVPTTGRVILLEGMRPAADIDAALACNRAAFVAAKAMAAGSPRLLVAVQDTGGRFGVGGLSELAAWRSGIAGLARTAGHEWADCVVRVIDLERGARAPAELATLLADELTAGGPEPEVGFPASGERLRLVDRAPVLSRGAVDLGASDVIVVSGGARGVTSACVRALASRGRGAAFALLGRTALAAEPAGCVGVTGDRDLGRAILQTAMAEGEKLTPVQMRRRVRGIHAVREIRQTLADLEAAGCRARYVSVDVTDGPAVAAALADCRSAWGPITGVVHGAGVLADKRIADKPLDSWDWVFGTKIGGMRSLLDATAGDPLRLLCMFSSVAGRSGNAGQSDYAMANEVLNKVAAAERARRGDACVVKSLGWGPWEGGMVSPELARHFAARGVPLIPLAVGGRMLLDELWGDRPGETEVVLGCPPWSEPRLTGEVTIDRRSHPHLAAHAIGGVPVVPVVLACEWFARLARAALPDLHLHGLSDIQVLRGIRLRGYDGDGDRFTVACRQLSNGDGVVLGLELRGEGGALHYSATAEVGNAQPTAGPAPHVAPLDDWAHPAIYGDVLFHGPDFQVIREIAGISRAGLEAELVGVQQIGWAEEPWQTDPAALDGALQIALLWARHAIGLPTLPTRVAQLRLFADAPQPGPLRCVARGRLAEGRRTVSDLFLMDANGQVIAELRGVETHAPASAGAPSARA